MSEGEDDHPTPLSGFRNVLFCGRSSGTGSQPQSSQVQLDQRVGQSNVDSWITSTPTSATTTMREHDGNLIDGNENMILHEELPLFDINDSQFMREEKLVHYGRHIHTKLENGRGFCLITGVTGSGKSTICPLAMLKLYRTDLIQQNQKIIVGVPRKVAGRLLVKGLRFFATKVGLCESDIGFVTHTDSDNVHRCKLLVCTSGWLFVKLSFNLEYINKIHSILIDEIHEQQVDSEMQVALFMMHELQHHRHLFHGSQTAIQCLNRPPNIVLVSATIDESHLVKHMRSKQWFMDRSIPHIPLQIDSVCVRISAGVNLSFQTEVLDLIEAGKVFGVGVSYGLDKLREPRALPMLHPEMIRYIFEFIRKCISMRSYGTGLVLVCVPGVGEINSVIAYYEKYKDQWGDPLRLYEFHGTMDKSRREAVEKAIQNFETSRVPVLVSSPITDSSVTLKNCSIVIDSCLIRKMEVEEMTQIEVLRRNWADRDIQTQRKGRTGRECDGIYIKLLPDDFYTPKLPAELQTRNLEDALIRVYTMAQIQFYESETKGNTTKIIRNFLLTKLPDRKVENAIAAMLNIGVLQMKPYEQQSTAFPYDNYHLSIVGEALARVRIKSHFTRGPIIASIFSCYQPISHVMALVSLQKSDFWKDETEDLKMLIHMKDLFSRGHPSDHALASFVFIKYLNSIKTTRVDGKPKLCAARKKDVEKSMSKRGHGYQEDLNNDDFHGIHPHAICKMDKFIDDTRKKFGAIGVSTASGSWYMRETDYSKLEQRRIEQLEMETFSLIMSHPHQMHFLSQPSYWLERVDRNTTPLLSTVSFYPCPDANTDVREWGPQIMMEFVGPDGIWPSLVRDNENGVGHLIFPQGSVKNHHLGLIHKSARNALHRTKFHKEEDYDFLIVYTNGLSHVKEEDRINTFTPSVVKHNQQYEKETSADVLVGNQTIWQICEFMSPNNFGVRILQRDETRFQQICDEVFAQNVNLHNVTFEQCVIGQMVIVHKPESENPANPSRSTKWNQMYMRGVIAATFSKENLYPKQDSNPFLTEILIHLIDVGVTQHVSFRHVYYFDEYECNYSIPDLFSRFPGQGYNVSLNSLCPKTGLGWDWLRDHVRHMNLLLKRDWQHMVRLDIIPEESSKYFRRIVVKDIHPFKDNNVSFRRICVDNGWASVLRNTVFFDECKGDDNPNYCPRPLTKEMESTYRRRAIRLQKRWRNPEIYTCSIAIQTVFSSIQVDWKTLIPTDKNFELIISNQSINAGFMDYRLADKKISNDDLSRYSPLLAVGTHCHLVQYGDNLKVKSNMTTISTPIPDIVPIIETCVFPEVEAIFDPTTNMVQSINVYNKNFNGERVFVRTFKFKTTVNAADMEILQTIRSAFNQIHVGRQFKFNRDDLCEMLSAFLQKRRSLNQITSETLYPSLSGTPFTPECMFCTFTMRFMR